MAAKNNLKSLSADDRPREKMLSLGRQNLSDSELLAIIIGSGSRGESVIDLSKRILKDYDNNLNELGKITIKDLTRKYKGIGEVKAINIIAALELGRRRQNSDPLQRPTISSSKDAFNYLYPFLADKPHEEFWFLLCNRSNRIIHKEFLGRGGVAGVMADSKLILKSAITHLASGIILSHNHPSGNLKPSKADINLTEKVIQGAMLFDIRVLDHIIIGDMAYYSFADEGLI